MGVRKFETGATRDTDAEKYDLFGFQSALVRRRFAEYMHACRHQSDGVLRTSDNWKLGIPEIEYVRSLCRHVLDVELVYEGFPERARSEVEEALCGVLFNAQGLLYEILKRREVKE